MSNYLEYGSEFNRDHSDKNTFSYIGTGAPGGKGAGLIKAKALLDKLYPENIFEGMSIDIPTMTIILTDIFDSFITQNLLDIDSLSKYTDTQIALKFQKASIPPLITGDLRSLILKNKTPLAIRSSSLLEDSVDEPFAGVYATKMVPNNDPAPETRFKKLLEAIKFVYASTWFKESRDYFKSAGLDIKSEKMAVIIQRVEGLHHGDNFYPVISGVARSYNFYPFGTFSSEDGICELALGLGKTIVDGGRRWTYCPQAPSSPPPATLNSLLAEGQKEFWTVSLKPPEEYNPVEETEYMHLLPAKQAETDGVLLNICSTYNPESDRMEMGLLPKGPRLLDFSPVLKGEIIPFNGLIQGLLKNCKNELGSDVEIEFAVSFDHSKDIKPRLGFLQVRPMKLFKKDMDIQLPNAEEDASVKIYSELALGHGVKEYIRDIVYIPPDKFLKNKTGEMAREIEKINNKFLETGKKYILIGFGRWGSSDPWLGIPVKWSHISGASVIIEATLPEMNPDLSQGSHFFHNISNLGIFYFTVDMQRKGQKSRIDYQWLSEAKPVFQGKYFDHISFDSDLGIIVDGKTGKGVIFNE